MAGSSPAVFWRVVVGTPQFKQTAASAGTSLPHSLQNIWPFERSLGRGTAQSYCRACQVASSEVGWCSRGPSQNHIHAECLPTFASLGKMRLEFSAARYRPQSAKGEVQNARSSSSPAPGHVVVRCMARLFEQPAAACSHISSSVASDRSGLASAWHRSVVSE